jgi:cytochrome c-type protein NapC
MGEPSTKRGLWSRRTLFGATLGAALVFMILGVIFWGGFNTAMEATNNMEFCISCHEMEENVYREYRGTVHDANRSGVRAGCPDCHVPRPWIHKVVRKIQASNEIYHKIMGTVSTPEKFEANRLTMAKRVWAAMKKTDSRECRNCHDITAMNPVNQKPRARQQHLNAMERGQTCIDCHKGIAHKPVHTQLTDAELEALEKPNPDFIRPIPASYTAGLERVEAAEAEAKAKAQEARQREREAQAAMKAEQEARMAAAVAAAIEAYKAGQAGAAVAAPAVAAAADGGFGIDWSDVPGREVVLFYPGQSSMEWILNGRDHSGKRAFQAGDRCFDCHDKEAADIGRKIVTGEKLEPQPIEGKRGSIPVTVQAAHDAENLYLRFQWEDTPHVPVPFVEGGKMDPENPVKLALMLATDEVEYADRAGCWGTCHHDLRSMPDEASPDATKYLTESRTEIEIRGRGDKPRGGWDKRKGEAEVAAALEAGHFMDLLRFKSGAGAAEDGHVLADRVMEGGQGTAMSGRLENGMWTVTVKRKLATGAPGDVTLEPGRLYNIGFAIHDDFSAARWHHVSVGYKLGLDNPDAEINVTAQ